MMSPLLSTRFLFVTSMLVANVLAWTSTSTTGTSTRTSTLALQQSTFQHATRRISFGQHNSLRSGRFALFMGWGPDPIWSTATVVSVESACPSNKSILMKLTVPAETTATYLVPGQYVQVRLDESTKPAFLAICSPPNTENTPPDQASSFDFLIKKTESNEWLTSLNGKAAIEVSQVLGNGYATAENLDSLKYDFPTQNVLLFGAGSGLAPIAAAIESGILSTSGSAGSSSSSRTCRLYYGEQTADDLCFVDRFAKWEEMGVEVVPVLSQPEGGSAGSSSSWNGRTGYIQTALAEDGIAIPRNTGALLCGMKGMTESVKELLLAAGVFEGRVLFNF